jgi:hypothetical protein
MSSTPFFKIGSGFNINVDFLKFNTLNTGFVYLGDTGSAGIKHVGTNELVPNINLSGVPTVDTASSGTNTPQIANTAFVQTAIANLVDSAPATLDTLNEIAAALGDDANFATTVTDTISGKVSKTGNETISGVKTFTVLPESTSVPATNNQLTNKLYVDTKFAAIGTQGATGAQGFTGATGVTGTQGFTGATGVTGTQGFTGATGVTGAQGAQGTQGNPGYSIGVTGVLISNDNTDTTMYPVFTSGTGASSLLNIDSDSGPLSYNPSTSNLSATTFNNVAIGSTGTNVWLGDSSTTMQIQGALLLTSKNVSGTLTAPFSQLLFYSTNNFTYNNTLIIPNPSNEIIGLYFMMRLRLGSESTNRIRTASSLNVIYDISGTLKNQIPINGLTNFYYLNNEEPLRGVSFICDGTYWYQLTEVRRF